MIHIFEQYPLLKERIDIEKKGGVVGSKTTSQIEGGG
jgi:hypothetical protein